MYEQHLQQQQHLKDCADYQLHNPWKLKLRRLGKHVRKFMAHLAPGRLRKKRQGYSKFYTEDEERLRHAARQEMSVYDSESGELLGTLSQNWNALRPSFSVRDAYGEPVLGIKGPSHLRCCGPRELDFIINSTGKQQSSVGVITKKWSSDLARSFFKDGQSIGIGFPVDLDVKIKAVLLGACFLIDFMYFEDNDNGRRHNNHRSCS